MKVTRWVGNLDTDQVLTVHSDYSVAALSHKGPRKSLIDLLPGEKIPFGAPIPSAIYRRLLRKVLLTWRHDECHLYFLSQENNRALFASNKPFTLTELGTSDRLPFEVVPLVTDPEP